MSKVRLRHWHGRWSVDVLKGAEATVEAAWVCLGGSPSPIAAMRLYWALRRQEERDT